jgi:hypothetical protein
VYKIKHLRTRLSLKKALKRADNKAREIIAERIIELAQHGECSPTKLRDRVLAESAAR